MNNHVVTHASQTVFKQMKTLNNPFNLQSHNTHFHLQTKV